MKTRSSLRLLLLVWMALFCAPVLAVLEPIPDNSGRYMSPYTSDGVFAEWVNRSIDTRTGAAVGGAVGAYAGDRAMRNVPLVGGFLGSRAGQAVGREAALQAAGGESFIRESSDLSFNSLEDLAQWMYLTHGDTPNYPDAVNATGEVYPEFARINDRAVATANERILSAGGIGAALEMRAGLLTVIELIEDSPAQRAGLRENDVIVRIDGEMVRDEALQNHVRRLRGEVGSEVKLAVLRDGDDGMHNYAMLRERIDMPTAQPEPATRQATTTPGRSRPEKAFADHNHSVFLALSAASGDISGAGFTLGAQGLTSTPEELGWFWGYGMTFTSGDDMNNEIDYVDMHFAVGPSYSFSDNTRGYAAITFDMIEFDPEVGVSTTYSGMNYRFGSEFRFPDQRLILDLGANIVDMDDDDDFDTISYTGPYASLQYGFNNEFLGVFSWKAVDDEALMSFGVGGRF